MNKSVEGNNFSHKMEWDRMVYVAYGIGEKEVRRQKLKCWYKQGDCKYVCIFHDQRMWASLLTLALILSKKLF